VKNVLNIILIHHQNSVQAVKPIKNIRVIINTYKNCAVNLEVSMKELNYEQEKARRRRQIERGQLKEENGLISSQQSFARYIDTPEQK